MEMVEREPREGQELKRHYLVLSRSCADLYDEIVKLFANRPNIVVIIDRRKGEGAMAEIPPEGERRAARRERRRGQTMVLVPANPKPEKPESSGGSE
jgi:hypothetical protein